MTDAITLRLVEGNPTGGNVSYNGQTYVPCAVTRQECEQSIEGELTPHALTVSNIDGVAGGYIERYDVEDRTVRVIRVLASTLAVADSMVETYTILSQSYNRKAATISLGPPNFFKRSVPWRKFTRRCQWDWENRFTVSNGCGFPSDEFEVDSEQDLRFGTTTDNLKICQHGWNVLNALQCSSIDVDLSVPGSLYIETSGGSIDWSGGVRDGPFVFKRVAGNFDVSTKVDLYESRSGSLAGILCQEDAAGYDSWVAVGISQDQEGSRFMLSRAATNGTAGDDVPVAGVSVEYVRLARVVNAFFAYYSADGATWTLIGTRTIALDSAVRIGLVLAAPPTTSPNVSAAFPHFRFTVGGVAACERTLDFCRTLGNTRRIFAFPGVPRK
ncbi:MAG: DUF1349 domain-containing protein [Pseudomonadota bacterium]